MTKKENATARIKVTPKLHKKLKILAAKHKCTISVFVNYLHDCRYGDKN